MSEGYETEPVKAKKGSKTSMAAWLTARLRRESQVYRGFAVLLALGFVIALVITGAVAEMLALAFNSLLFGDPGIPRILLNMIALGLVVGLFFLARFILPQLDKTVRVECADGETRNLKIRAATGPTWLAGFSGDSDRPAIVRFAETVIFATPRLADLTFRAWRLANQLQQVNTARLSRVVDLLIRSGGRVPLERLLAEFPNEPPQDLLDELNLFDGVVWLLKPPPGVTLSPGLEDEYERWRSEARRRANRA